MAKISSLLNSAAHVHVAPSDLVQGYHCDIFVEKILEWKKILS